MSQKRIATRSSSKLKAQESGGERGGEDGGSQNQGQGQGPIVAPAAPTTKDDFMATDDFMRLMRGYVDVVDLFHTFRLVSKPWQRIAEEKIDGDFRSGVLAFHNGNDVGVGRDDDDLFWESLRAKRTPVKQVIFLLNITKVGARACWGAVNLVVVDIPEGVDSIGESAFEGCHSLTTVYFPMTLTSIGDGGFWGCFSLENADLFHTNLQELVTQAFLKSITIPDSLQTVGDMVFCGCLNLVPASIAVYEEDPDDDIDVTNEVVIYLRDQQRIAADLASKLTAPLHKNIAKYVEKVAALEAMVAALSLENVELKTKIVSTTPPPPVDDFMATNDFRRYLSQYIPVQDLLRTFRLVCKQWRDVAEEIIDRNVESGELIVHGGKDISMVTAMTQEESPLLTTRVIFLLNITKVGERACYYAVNFVVVDIPEGVESIGEAAFESCSSLTTVSFPTTIGFRAFLRCKSLENIDLLHTNLQELGNYAFCGCRELKSMTIPDSLQTLGGIVFWDCSKLVPSNIEVNVHLDADPTSDVIAYLRYLQI